MDRANLTREQLDEKLRPLLADGHGEHHVLPDRRGHARNNLSEITWLQVADEHGEYNVFADQRPVVALPVEAPANPQAPMATLSADEEDLAVLLAMGSAVGLPRQIEREALNPVIRPAIVDTDLVPTVDLVDDDAEGEALNTEILPAIVGTGLVPTVGLVDNGDGSGLTLTPTLEVHVAGQTK